MNELQLLTHFFRINSGLDYEIVKIAFLLSLVISLLVYHKYHNAPVGIIVPGVILLSVGYPSKLLGLVVISGLVYFSAKILQKYIFTHTILSKREKVLILVLLSTVFSFFASLMSHTLSVFAFGGIGIVVPAMVADSLTRSFKYESIKSLFFATIYTIIAFIILKLLAINFLSNEYKYYLDTLYLQRYVFNFELDVVMYLLFAVAVIYNIILYRKKKLKSVGLLLGAYLGLLIFQPLQLFFVLVVTFFSYIITALVHKYVMVYGYRVFVLSASVVTVMYSIFERVFFTISHQSFHPFFGVYVAGNIAGALICTLLVSEAIQHGYKKTLIVSTLMTIILAGTLYAAQVISPSVGMKINIAALLEKSEAKFVALQITEKKSTQTPAQLSFVETARKGDSVTILVRRTILAFEKINGKSMKDYQRVYVETKLVTAHKKSHLVVGDKINISYQEISNFADKSEWLSKETINVLKSYEVNYNYL